MKAKSLLSAALAVAITATTMSQASAADVTLRFSNVTNKPSVDAGQVLCDVAAKESNGRLEIKHFPNNMLGDDRTVTESMLMGDIALVQTKPSVFSFYGSASTFGMLLSYLTKLKMLGNAWMVL